jgi:hypothetical protein
MEKYLDGWDLAAHVRFMRQTHKGSFLLVEGSWDDRILSRFVDSGCCSIEVAFGKPNAVEALNLLEEEGFEGVVAIVDADFDRLDRVEYNLEGLILTDHHDLDLTILLSPALKTFLDFRADGKKLRDIANGDLSEIALMVLKSAEPIGYCRWLSGRSRLMLDFKDLTFDFIDQATLGCDQPAMIAEILTNSPAAKCTGVQFTEMLETKPSNEVELSQLVNGHDAATVLGIGLRQILAARPRPQTWRSEIEAGLRLAFDYEAFRCTRIWRSLREWEAAVGRFRVLRVP